MTVADRNKRLTAKRKFEVYLATREKDAPIGEILRKYGMHLSELKEIEHIVESTAIEALKVRNKHRLNDTVSSSEYHAVLTELQRKEKALAEMTVEYTLLKKNDNLGYMDPSTSAISRGQRGKPS
jgi:hypothetical protein